MNKYLLFLSLFIVSGLSAQTIDRQLIGNAGGSLSAGNIELSYSVGEAVIQSFTTGSIIVSQGFQQPNSGAGSNTSVSDFSLDDQFSFYPNPVNSTLFLKFKSGSDNLDLAIRVYDLKGVLILQQNEIMNQGAQRIIELNLGRLSTGNYFLQITDSGGKQSGFTIIKT